MVLQGQDIELITGENNFTLQINLTTDTGGPLILTGTTLTWKLIDQNGVAQITKNAGIIGDGTAFGARFSSVTVILEKTDTAYLNLNLDYTHELWEVKSDSSELMLTQGDVTFVQGHAP